MRLDVFLVESGEFTSREKAKEAIKNGCVFVDGKEVTKASAEVGDGAKVEVKKTDNFVSRGAYKLRRAYEVFDFSFGGKVVLDIGASTGGFTQFSLLNGAKKVYAVDVGRGELSPLLISDKRVVNLENTDFRKLPKDICADANLIIGDVSFISLKHIFPKIVEIFGCKTEIVMLFKPQFECGAEIAKKFKGVVLDRRLHEKLLTEFLEYAVAFGFSVSNLTYSDLRGKEGNIEYLFHLNGPSNAAFSVKDVVSAAFNQK